MSSAVNKSSKIGRFVKQSAATVFSFVIIGFSLGAQCYELVNRPFGVISDIDDTIKYTFNRHEGRTPEFLYQVIRNQPFAGMPRLYRALSENGAEFYYVTGAPKFLKPLPARFLKSNGFPEGPLSLRTSMREDMQESKYQRVLRILEQNPHRDFYLLGDNGEGDVEWTHRLLENAQVTGQIKFVGIHNVYPSGVGHALRSEEQTAYATAADLALAFYQDGRLNADQIEDVFHDVLKAERPNPSGQTSHSREAAMPKFSEIQFDQLKVLMDFTRRPSVQENPTLTKITSEIIQIYRDHDPAARTPEPAPVQCFRAISAP